MENFQIDMIAGKLEERAEYIATNYSLNTKFDTAKLTTIVCDIILGYQFESSFDDIIMLVTAFKDKIEEKRAEVAASAI